ncbi:2-amino-4-hydroxy-6-hydroxymethyldihydropteridine diphosphokinase [Propionibacterium sp. oral taxon 192 str. F0372]|uniref:2-amino-4-hydroxy-6- hydroxymethyldihydropteridine diphosphokinase n=1 Tax=Propionibacterium sp. oral taxon 192 TaxID=671222 RepID=UPI00035394BA|nr:2-amino-4-hydroxy-6-hydroxymethyldihydropteridine diphosphokinase [Propionibacterium sp. oral taxon 192]EPH03280.1 2-amino-4-hydroxy-6-hydroxymethyldihydropteridine diphosphokinase [Propionibacterium sp. oral taxon 192 str. F0372]
MSELFSVDADTLGNLRPLNRVVFSLGSNLGDSLEILQAAVDNLAETPNLILVGISPVYRTTPWGGVEQPDFLNIVVIAESTLEPLTLLDRCAAIEEAYGRERDPQNPYGPRTLDIDLIVVGSRTSDTEELRLPHPRAHLRAFVLVPWLDLEPRAVLPQGPVAELVTSLDTTTVEQLEDVSILGTDLNIG